MKLFKPERVCVNCEKELNSSLILKAKKAKLKAVEQQIKQLEKEKLALKAEIEKME